MAPEPQKFIGDLVRQPSRCSRTDDLLCTASEILDQQDAQGDRRCPELAGRQWLHALIGANHATKTLRIESTVGMGDVCPRQAQDSWVAGQGTVGQLWKLAIVVRVQIVAYLAQLLVDDREVVDQPFSGWRHRPLVLGGAGQQAV